MNGAQFAFPWFPLAFVGMWFLVCGLLAYMSGWSALADRFRATDRPSGRTLSGQVMGIGSVNENGVTRLMVTPGGLYMYPLFLFRFKRPPLLIPWHEIQYESTRKVLWTTYHRLRLGGDITTLRIKDKGFQELLPFLPAISKSAWQG